MPTGHPDRLAMAEVTATLDRLLAVAESGRLQRRLHDDLQALEVDDLGEFSDTLTTFAERVSSALTALEEWMVANDNGEDAETRRDCREAAVEAVNDLADAFTAMQAAHFPKWLAVWLSAGEDDEE